MEKTKRYLTAGEATAALGVNRATLYAYVSRGLIRSEPTGEGHKAHRYRADDVQKLADRKAQRQNPAKAAEDALHWGGGGPVLESALTFISEHGLYYRGRNALRLANEATFEAVAALLWAGDEARVDLFETERLTLDLPWRGGLLPTMQIALTVASERDLTAYDLRPERVIQTGARILWLLTKAIAPGQLISSRTKTIAGTLAQAWGVDDVRLIDAALILCADHELNASSFTARVVASTDATPYQVVTGGLAALQGAKHGGHTRRVSAFLREVAAHGDPRAVIAGRLQRGEIVPGFGHRLYPDGDPRAAFLLARLADGLPDSPDVALGGRIAQAVRDVLGEAPTVDFALAVMERALQLPDDAALALFALGRSVGLLAHALEQYVAGQLIRPRAKYVGVAVEEKDV